MEASTQAGRHPSTEAEAQWRELFEHSPVMYFMVDPAGTVLAVNSFGAAQLGYAASELVGQSVLQVFFPDDKQAARSNLELCLQTLGQQNKWEIRKVRKDGTLLWVRENAKAVQRSDGDLIVLIACEDINERKRAEQRQAAQYGVTRVLAESDSLAAASADLLRMICEALGWDWGALWSAGQQPERLRCDCIWHASGLDIAGFDAASRENVWAPGQGRASQVWQTGQPLWIADVAKDSGFRRGDAAATAGLHAFFACPILLGGEALGVVEFLSRRIREPDEQELVTLRAIGSQIGQFIQRKRAEEAVQASEKRFRALIEHSYDVVLLASAEATVLYASPSVEKVLGYAPEELIGRSGYDLVHPDHLQGSISRFTRSTQQPGAVVTGERLLLHKDGSSRWIENVIVNLLSEPSVQAIVMHLRDISERKRAEEALRASEERFRALIQFSFDVYWETDAQHRFVRQEFSEGLSDAPTPGSEIGKTRWELPYLEPDEEAWRKHRETLDAHLPFRDFELARPTPDGGKRYVSVSGLPAFDEAGHFIGYRGVGRHITERKRIEEALRQREKELREIVETIPAMTVTIAPDGRDAFIGKRFFEYSGLSEEKARGSGWKVTVHPDDLGLYLRKWRPSLMSGDPVEFETRVRRADGEYRWFLARAVAQRDERGNIVKWYEVLTDIEDRKRAEQALRRSEAYLAEAQRLSHTGSFAYKPSSRKTLFWSEELFRIFKLDPRRGIPDYDETRRLVHPDDLETVSATCLQGFREKAEFSQTYRLLLRDGTVKHLQAVWHPIVDETGEVAEYVGTAADVTEREQAEQNRKRAEAALRASEEQWKAVFENNPVMYFMVGETGTIISVNPFGAEQLGYRVDELIGHPVTIVFYEPDRAVVQKNAAACFERPGQAMSWELRKVRKNGEVIWVRETARATVINNCPVLLIVCEDISEGKHAAEALREAQMELAHANRIATMGHLTASIAHEVSQPVATARNNASATLNFLDRSPPDLEEVKEALTCVLSDTDRARDIIGRIRDHIKKAPPRRDSFDLNEAIHEVIALARSEVAKNGVSVHSRLAEGWCVVHADHVQVQQVVLNLILNAIETMSSGDEGPRELLISTEHSQTDGIIVAVRDSGPGIDPEQLDRVFDAFYTTKSSGVGMGLSICRSIIAAHGGRLWAEANKPKGAVFRFTLPTDNSNL
jgi:PAS domain S-box-containing protein